MPVPMEMSYGAYLPTRVGVFPANDENRTGIAVQLGLGYQDVLLSVSASEFPIGNALEFPLNRVEEGSSNRVLVSTLIGKETVNSLIAGERPESIELSDEEVDRWILLGHIASTYHGQYQSLRLDHARLKSKVDVFKDAFEVLLA